MKFLQLTVASHKVGKDSVIQPHLPDGDLVKLATGKESFLRIFISSVAAQNGLRRVEAVFRVGILWTNQGVLAF